MNCSWLPSWSRNLFPLWNSKVTQSLLLHSSFDFRGFVLCSFANPRGRHKHKIQHSDPSVDGNIETVRQLEQVFQPHRTMFEEFKEEKKQLPIQCFWGGEKKKTLQIIIFLRWGRGGSSQLLTGFRFFRGMLEPTPVKSESWIYLVSLFGRKMAWTWIWLLINTRAEGKNVRNYREGYTHSLAVSWCSPPDLHLRTERDPFSKTRCSIWHIK